MIQPDPFWGGLFEGLLEEGKDVYSIGDVSKPGWGFQKER